MSPLISRVAIMDTLEKLQDAYERLAEEMEYYRSEARSWDLDLDEPEEVAQRLEEYFQSLCQLRGQISVLKEQLEAEEAEGQE